MLFDREYQSFLFIRQKYCTLTEENRNLSGHFNEIIVNFKLSCKHFSGLCSLTTSQLVIAQLLCRWSNNCSWYCSVVKLLWYISNHH